MADENKLLLRLKNRDVNALNEAIEIYTPYLSTVLYNMAGNKLFKEDVEEIISDVFVVLWKNVESIDLTKGTVRSYIAKIAQNYALKSLNKQKNYIPIDEVDIIDENDFVYKNSISALVWNAVMRLGEPDNEIFVRYYRFGERLRDISKATGIKISTIKTKLLRGRIKLKKFLSDTEEFV